MGPCGVKKLVCIKGHNHMNGRKYLLAIFPTSLISTYYKEHKNVNRKQTNKQTKSPITQSKIGQQNWEFSKVKLKLTSYNLFRTQRNQTWMFRKHPICWLPLIILETAIWTMVEKNHQLSVDHMQQYWTAFKDMFRGAIMAWIFWT